MYPGLLNALQVDFSYSIVIIFSEEKRMIISLDMHEMNRIKWIDYQSMIACIECGVIGKDLDAKLNKLGLCLGHEPGIHLISI